MIRTISLSNFKTFRNFTLELAGHNVLIGPNNAGKSTIVQALRLVDVAVRNWQRTRRPSFVIPEEKVPFSLRNARNLYATGSQAVQIVCTFSEGATVTLNLEESPSAVEAVISTGRHGIRTSLGFQPPLGPLEEDEKLVQKDTVRKTMNTHLAPRHFRNLWYHYPEEFDEFSRLLRQTWPGVMINKSNTRRNPELNSEKGCLYMFYEENRVERELSWAGSGLQIWMQILTFLVKNQETNVLIFDEPELYLHADIQRRIGITALSFPKSQVIIATHSVEIVNEVEPEQIITVDPTLERSTRLGDVSAVQKAISHLGSVQNLHLSRLARSKRSLFVEGEDFKLLKRIQQALGIPLWEDGHNFSVFPLEGFDNWTLLKGLDWVFKNVLNEKIHAFVILDRDYRTDSQVAAVTANLQALGVHCHIWNRKEIENYFLSEELVFRGIMERLHSRGLEKPTEEIKSWVSRILVQVTENLRPETFSQMLAQYQVENRGSHLSAPTVNLNFTMEFDKNWGSQEWRTFRIGGKDAFNNLNRIMQVEYKISLSPYFLAGLMGTEDLPSELATVLNELSRFANPSTLHGI